MWSTVNAAVENKYEHFLTHVSAFGSSMDGACGAPPVTRKLTSAALICQAVTSRLNIEMLNVSGQAGLQIPGEVDVHSV